MSRRDLWIDGNTGRLRSGWRALAFVVVSLPISLLLFALLQLTLKVAGLGLTPESPLLQIIAVLAAAPVSVGVGIWALRMFEGLPAHTLGITPSGPWLRQMVLEFLAGLGLVGILVLVLWVARAATLAARPVDVNSAVIVLASAAFLAAYAIFEETFFHGYAFQTLLRGIGPLATLLLAAAAFAIAHLGNPHVTRIGLANTFLIGVLFGMLYLRAGSLWLPIGVHAGWNLAQALLQLPISGLSMPGSATPALMTTALSGPAELTGGGFGVEGSLVSSALLLGAIALATFTRHGLPLESYWWEWRALRQPELPPPAWDFSVDSRHYQWKLTVRDDSSS